MARLFFSFVMVPHEAKVNARATDLTPLLGVTQKNKKRFPGTGRYSLLVMHTPRAATLTCLLVGCLRLPARAGAWGAAAAGPLGRATLAAAAPVARARPICFSLVAVCARTSGDVSL